MKKNIGVWLDSKKAFIISLLERDVLVDKIVSDVENRVRFEGEKSEFTKYKSQYVDTEKKHQERKKHQLNRYYSKIVNRISHADEVVIFGPAGAKVSLKKEILKRKDFITHIKKIESSDNLTEKQMISRVKSYFGTSAN